MAKKKAKLDLGRKEKEASENGVSETSNNAMDSIASQSDYSTEDTIESMDSKKSRHFWFVVYPTEQYLREHFPDCEYDGSSGWGTAPDDWIERLRMTGLAFNVSPLHLFDKNPDGSPKKPHWHVIVSWANTTTYRSARALCDVLNCPRPLLLSAVVGAYRYHQHRDNPEKYQYVEPSVSYNGWEVPLDSTEVKRIKKELKHLVLLEDIREYAELLIVCDEMGDEYFDVASNNTFFCDKLCSSYRHNPIKVLMRFIKTLPEGEDRCRVKQRLDSMIESMPSKVSSAVSYDLGDIKEYE